MGRFLVSRLFLDLRRIRLKPHLRRKVRHQRSLSVSVYFYADPPLGQDTKTSAESTQQQSSSEQPPGAPPPVPRPENLLTPMLPPFNFFSDPITAERRNTPSTDEQCTESRTTANSTDSGEHVDYNHGNHTRSTGAEMAPSSSRSNNQNAQRKALIPSSQSSPATPGRSRVISHMSSTQLILSPRPKVTMEEIHISSAEAGELENEDPAPIQPTELPQRTRLLVHDRTDRYERNARIVFHQGNQQIDQSCWISVKVAIELGRIVRICEQGRKHVKLNSSSSSKVQELDLRLSNLISPHL